MAAPDRPLEYQISTVVLENCEKSAAKHSKETPILLNLMDLSTIFCRSLNATKYFFSSTGKLKVHEI